jgi:hypothetical protein
VSRKTAPLVPDPNISHSREVAPSSVFPFGSLGATLVVSAALSG